MPQTPAAHTRIGKVDLHGHLLPGVDDGCRTLEESVDCAGMLVDAGYTHASATPHVMPQFPGNNRREIARRVRELQAAYDSAGVGLTLVPGGELNMLDTMQLEDEIDLGEVVSYGLAGKWVLFDFWTDSVAELERYVVPGVTALRKAGYQLLLAHPERISVFQRDDGVLDELVGRGVKLQLNSWCLVERPGSRLRELAERWLLAGRYHVLGTDLHRREGMPARLDGISRAEELIGATAFDEMMRRARDVAGIVG
ncbi:MAG TPA: CpsB/CapC family capsule biosynthesis tyrosine phosphatase [Tepidisphaeraceae bacterium]|nr:CpsB/CapC family capsule biosynthesis tyrosine phosphatase [Tepidisphaeraceae bacterium]